MKWLVIAVALCAFSFVADMGKAHAIPGMGVEQGMVQHGGGCRKSSPPGQCCHMERRTGTVHCH